MLIQLCSVLIDAHACVSVALHACSAVAMQGKYPLPDTYVDVECVHVLFWVTKTCYVSCTCAHWQIKGVHGDTFAHADSVSILLVFI